MIPEAIRRCDNCGDEFEWDLHYEEEEITLCDHCYRIWTPVYQSEKRQAQAALQAGGDEPRCKACGEVAALYACEACWGAACADAFGAVQEPKEQP